MELLDAIYARHSVRSYTDRPIEGEALQALEECIDQCNREGNLHIQLVLEESRAFASTMAHYGKFSGVRNYVALVAGAAGEVRLLRGKDRTVRPTAGSQHLLGGHDL